MLEAMEAFFDRLLTGDRDAILAVVCAYFLAAAGWSLAWQARVRRWPSVRGRLCGLCTRRFGASAMQRSDQDYVAEAAYSYTVNGHTYAGQRVSAWVVVASHNLKGLLTAQLKQVEVLEDDTVTVYYNPNDPEKAFLLKPGRLGMCFTAFLGLLPLAIYLSG